VLWKRKAGVTPGWRVSREKKQRTHRHRHSEICVLSEKAKKTATTT
jgi:uncharacterized protein YbdZ (MbtH family)